MKRALVKFDLQCNWLKNVISDSMSEWEMGFIDSIWIDEVSLTINQEIKLDEIYRKYRFGDHGVMRPSVWEYGYIHDFDR